MAPSRPTKRQRRALDTLREKGWGLSALGLAFLLAPMFVGKSPLLASIANGLRLPGGLALTAGAVLLGIHHITTARVAKTPPPTSSTSPEPHQIATHWGPAVFAAIEWRRFEAVCEALFAQAGFETKSQSHGADGGVDIWLHGRNAEEPVAVVQCKHWQTRAVGVKEMREFFGVMAAHKVTRGTFITTSTYTADAQQFALDNDIHALDSKGVLKLIAKQTPEQQQALLDVAYEGEYWRPTCASCGVKMVQRAPAKSGVDFWGCSNYPQCKSRLFMASVQHPHPEVDSKFH